MISKMIPRSSVQEDKKLNVVSLFSGCGGSSLGYKMGNCNVLASVEFVQAAAQTYRANHPKTIVIEEDIRKITGDDILNLIGLKKGELDILDGSPPCASFSTAGKREKLWGKVKKYSDREQRTDDLFFEYLRIVDEMQPKFAVAENVVGLTIGEAKRVLNEILESFTKIGYTPNYQIMDGAEYGAPQHRRRVIIVASRNDVLDTAFNYPKGTHSKNDKTKKPLISVKEAIQNIQNDPDELKMLFEAGEKYAQMELYDELEVGKNHPIRFSLCKNRWDEPSRTIMASDGKLSLAGTCHPFEKRRHTIAEAKALMGFPSDYILLGTWDQQMERLGRSVCPQVLKAVQERIKVYIHGTEDEINTIKHDNLLGYW